MVLDLAIRVAVSGGAPHGGVVIVDEIEQHLHPAWQARVLPALLAAFPTFQFVATTHSPLVVTSVPSGAVRLLDRFEVHELGPTAGRDANSLLGLVFGVSPRPEVVADELRRIEQQVDADDLVGARAALDALGKRRTTDDPDIVRRSLVDFLGS